MEGRRYLLLMGCSQSKLSQSGLIPAFERYTGVNYMVLRKAQREGYWPNTLRMLILSAKYSLLDPQTLIEHYDQRMTSAQAKLLQPKTGAELDVILREEHFDEVFVNLGQDYLLALATSQELPRLDGRVHYASGGIGARMAQMKRWLMHIANHEVPFQQTLT